MANIWRIFVTRRVSQFDRSSLYSSAQCLNMSSIFVTLPVFQADRSMSSSDLQFRKVLFISSTFAVSQ